MTSTTYNFHDVIAFIRSHFQTKDFIPLHIPVFPGNEKNYLSQTIDSGFVSSVGEFVNQFEELMQGRTKSKKAVAVVNGTSALQVALRLVGVSPGDAVITQSLTFVATANAIKYNFAEPFFLDVDYDTMGLSPKSLKNFLEAECEKQNRNTFHKISNKKISACVPMHTFGMICHIQEIVSICDEWNIPVVEDATESLGSHINGKYTGTFGKMGVFSFNGNKIITSGGGGAIVTNDIELGEKAKYLTTTAKVSHEWEYFHDELGYNFRLPNLNAALACAQLESLDLFISNKRELAGKYRTFFTDSGLKFREETPNTFSNYWLMAIELEGKESRDAFLEQTNGQGVMTRPIWQLMHRLPMYQSCYRDEQKNAEYLEQRIVNIPSSVHFS